MNFVSTDIDHYTHEQLKQAYYDLAFRYEELLPDIEYENLALALRYHASRQGLHGGTNQECGPQVIKLVMVLMSGRLMNSEQLTSQISGSDAGKKIAEVALCKARKILARFGGEIETIWGQGWRMPKTTIHMIEREIERYKARDIIDLSNHKPQAVRER